MIKKELEFKTYGELMLSILFTDADLRNKIYEQVLDVSNSTFNNITVNKGKVFIYNLDEYNLDIEVHTKSYGLTTISTYPFIHGFSDSFVIAIPNPVIIDLYLTMHKLKYMDRAIYPIDNDYYYVV